MCKIKRDLRVYGGFGRFGGFWTFFVLILWKFSYQFIYISP